MTPFLARGDPVVGDCFVTAYTKSIVKVVSEQLRRTMSLQRPRDQSRIILQERNRRPRVLCSEKGLGWGGGKEDWERGRKKSD